MAPIPATRKGRSLMNDLLETSQRDVRYRRNKSAAARISHG
jgi:hypothetical protein